KYFKEVFSSTSDFKLVKKNKKFYLKLLEKLNIAPKELLHIGDHYKFDYIIPKKLGINALYLDRAKERKGKFVIHGLDEIGKTLKHSIAFSLYANKKY
ncbi:MAG: hypothetical protein AB1779_10430, partial [Candidatus Thermoplasmatota archaeon]